MLGQLEAGPGSHILSALNPEKRKLVAGDSDRPRVGRRSLQKEERRPEPHLGAFRDTGVNVEEGGECTLQVTSHEDQPRPSPPSGLQEASPPRQRHKALLPRFPRDKNRSCL